MNTPRCFLLLVFTMLFLSASAQEEDNTEGRMLLSIGAGSFDVGKLNDALGASGYPMLNNVGWDWGISIWISDERLNFIYDFGSHARRAGSETTSDYDAGDFSLSFGYGVVHRQHFSLVPYLGIGAEFGRLELIQKEDPTVITVAGYIADVPRSQNMEMWGLFGAAGVYALWDFSSKSEKSNFTLGLHAGYAPRLMKQQWKSAGGEKLYDLNVPGGLSANLVFGVGF